MKKKNLPIVPISLLLLALFGCGEDKVPFGTLNDDRDDNTYKTIKIGNQTWMAENLNYKVKRSFCYENEEENCLKYGRIYTWYVATKRDVCPHGWHLPSLEEWQTLFKSVGGISNAAKALKTTRDWYEGCDGTDTYGFSAKPTGHAGNYFGPIFFEGNDGSHAYFWTSTKQDNFNAYAIDLPYSNEAVAINVNKKHGFSIRCIKDGVNEEPKHSEPQEKKEFDYKKYKTVQIGNRTWMAENLNEPTEDSYCYDDDPQNCEKYGRLYTFKAAQKACPAGWHLANSDDEREMLRILGESDPEKQGLMLASKEWILLRDYGDTRLPGTDVLGLAILPSGEKIRGRLANKEKNLYHQLGHEACLWLDSYYGGCCSDYINIDNYRYIVTGNDTSSAMAVRCVKDYKAAPAREATLHLNEKTIVPSMVKRGTFLDTRDNYNYKTVTIGEQTWFAENLRYKTSDATCNAGDEDCSQFGRLYDWYSAMDACPQGWRLPTKKEVSNLKKTVGGSAAKLKSVHGWERNGGTDDYGFSILPIGGKVTYIWTSTRKNNMSSAFEFGASYGHDGIVISPGSIRHRLSVRCIKD